MDTCKTHLLMCFSLMFNFFFLFFLASPKMKCTPFLLVSECSRRDLAYQLSVPVIPTGAIIL